VAAHDTLVAISTPMFVALLGVRDPAHPHQLASFGQGATWVRFDNSGTRLHLGSTSGAYDLSIDLNGTTYTLATHHDYGTGVISPVAPAGAYLDVVNGATLTTVRLSDYVHVGDYQAASGIRAVVGAANYAFIALATGSVEFIDQSGLGMPIFGASGGLPGAPTAIAFAHAGTESLVVVSHASGVSVLSYTALAADDPHTRLLPSEITLAGYPNPFNSTVQLSISVPRAGRYELSVFDILGRQVKSKNLSLTGTSVEPLEFSNLTSGLYFARLSGASSTAAVRLLYLP
jgi:hypothetical protein